MSSCCTLGELNPRPFGSEPNALSTELRVRKNRLEIFIKPKFASAEAWTKPLLLYLNPLGRYDGLFPMGSYRTDRLFLFYHTFILI